MNYEEKYKEAIYLLKELRPKISDYYREKLDGLFPELAESEDERIRKSLIDLLKNDEKHYLKEIDWLEKQSKKKLTDKVALKFKVGDWVVNKFGDVWCIDSFDKKYYQVCNGDKRLYFAISDQDEMRLWTIKDAKDGDVLASKDGNDILIFRKLDTTTSLSSYYNLKGRGELGWTRKNFIPATQEQCDLLFQKMKEAGYEWDAEKKELKEIAQEPAWSDADEERFVSCLQRLGTGNIEQPDTINTMWLKSLKNRVQSIAKFVGEGQYNKGFGDGVSKVLQNPEEYGLLPTPS